MKFSYHFVGSVKVNTEEEAKSCERLKEVPWGVEFRVQYYRIRLFTEKFIVKLVSRFMVVAQLTGICCNSSFMTKWKFPAEKNYSL